MTKRMTWKDKIRELLPWNIYWRLKRLREELFSFQAQGDLTKLAKVYKTDKWGYHFYTPIYSSWFRSLRHKPIKLLEIGVGGYAKPHHGGYSLRMWKRYFYKGTIIGIDIYDKSELQENRLRIYKGDQCDSVFLETLNQKEGPFEIIIDDGSHIQSHIIASFEALFPLMPSGGIYVIEDTQTSYWPKFEGSTSEMDTIPSAMNYFIKRIHTVNRMEWLKESLPREIPDQGISSISFYHNLIFIVKS